MGICVNGRRWVGAVLLGVALAMAGTAVAANGGRASVRKQIESSLLVEGQIDIEPDGSVSAVTVDREDKLPKGVVSLLRTSALQWKFEPPVVDGKPVRARSPMSARIVAKKVEADKYRIEIRSASFDKYDPNDPTGLRLVKRTTPSYPEVAYRSGVAGMVYLLLKIDRDGSVADLVAEQVNLRVVGSENEMRRMRDVLSRSALQAAREWKFGVPSQGESADQPFWVVRVPVNYSLQRDDFSKDESTRWLSYVPGPRQQVRWGEQDEDRAGFSPDALADGGVYLAGGRSPRLLTPLQGQ